MVNLPELMLLSQLGAGLLIGVLLGPVPVETVIASNQVFNVPYNVSRYSATAAVLAAFPVIETTTPSFRNETRNTSDGLAGVAIS